MKGHIQSFINSEAKSETIKSIQSAHHVCIDELKVDMNFECEIKTVEISERRRWRRRRRSRRSRRRKKDELEMETMSRDKETAIIEKIA